MRTTTHFMPILALSAFLLASCTPKTMKIKAEFDPQEVAFIFHDGKGTIKGQAFLRQRGGGIVTCAGREASLTPQTAYSKERMKAIYRTASHPAIGQTAWGKVKVEKPSPGYLHATRKTQCDAQGHFHFPNVPPGKYFVTTTVVWHTNEPHLDSILYQGGAVMAPVEIKTGEEVNIVISP